MRKNRLVSGVRKIMLVERVAHFVEISLNPPEIAVQTLLQDGFDGGIPDLAHGPADHSVDFLPGFLVAVALQPLEIALEPLNRIEHRPGEIFVEYYLLHDIAGVEAA